MAVGEMADDGGSNRLEKGEQTSECAAQQDDVISRVDGARKGGLVGIQVAEYVGEQGLGWRGRCIGGGFGISVELEELGE